MDRVKLAAAAIAAGAFTLPLPMLAGTAHAFPCPPGTPPGACGGGGHGGGGGQMPQGPAGGGGGWGGWGGRPVQHAPQPPMQPPVQQAPLEPPPVRQQPVEPPPVQQAPAQPPPVRQVPQEPAEPPPVHQAPQQTAEQQAPVRTTVQTPEAPVQQTPVHTPPPEQGTQPQRTAPITPPREGTPAAPTPPTKQVVTPQPSAPPSQPRPGGSPQPVTSAPQRGGPTEGPNQRQISQALVPPPVKADPLRVEQAKSAPPVIVDPIKPPPPPPGPAQAILAGDMTSHVDRAVNSPNRQVDVVREGDKAVVKPQHWGYQDYDQYHRTRFYNPLGVPLRVHYFYENAYRDVVVPALGLAVLAIADAGVYPYTAVGGDDYVTSGYFDGGAWIPPDGWDGPPPNDYVPPAPPPQYSGITAYVPAVDQNVGLDKVTVVGHDDKAPVGQQDTMMLNDTTLAWGQVDDPKDGGHVTVQKTQPTPGVGPTDDGRSIILAGKQSPMNNDWQKWLLGGILAAVATVGAAVLWIVKHPKVPPTEPLAVEGPSLGSIVETPTDMHSVDTMADPDHTMWQRP